MAKSKVDIGTAYKAPFNAAGRIIRELTQLTPAGRKMALQLVSEHNFAPAAPTADDRTGNLPFEGNATDTGL